MKTNRIILSLFIIAMVIAVACYLKFSQSTIEGSYVVGGFEMQDGVSKDQLIKNGLLDFGELTFQFLSNDTVILNPKFGMEFFGDSIFEYKVRRKSIEFIKGEDVISIPYANEGVISLLVNHKYIKILKIVHSKKDI